MPKLFLPSLRFIKFSPFLVTSLMLVSLFGFFNPSSVLADDSVCASVEDCNKYINQIQQQLDQARGQEKTLKSQLDYIDSQTKLTELKIQDTTYQIEKLESQIVDLSGRIDRLSTTVDSLTEVLLQRIITTYKYSNLTPMDLVFSSKGFGDLLEKFKYIQLIQAHDKETLYQLQATKANYNDQKQDKVSRQAQEEKLKKQLDGYQVQLAEQKKQKQQLLAETQGNEATYNRLISQAKSQLAGFSKFVASQGGASILSNQTSCDDWGCYYNQRDSQWGNVGLNGTSYSLAGDGCLVTSMAMIYTHYGHKGVTPLTINSSSNNFSAVAPTYLLKTITADGARSSRILTEIDNELAAGRPIIVGVGKGPDHFVVFISGSGGNYKMNDPFVPNGHGINFTDHYSLGSISEIDKVVF